MVSTEYTIGKFSMSLERLEKEARQEEHRLPVLKLCNGRQWLLAEIQ